MNKVFKVIWSEARNVYVVVSEMAKSHGTKSCSTKKLLAMLIATGVMTCASVAPVIAANPAPTDTKIEVGSGASAKGSEGVAIGKNSEAGEAGWATAIGGDAKATGNKSVVVGNWSTASGVASVTVGHHSVSSGNNAISIGLEAEAAGDNSFAFGNKANASGESSVAFGNGSKATHLIAIAIGSGAEATEKETIAIGGSAKATGLYSVAIGNHIDKTGEKAVAIGQQTKAYGMHATAVGAGSQAQYKGATAVGTFSKAIKEGSIALGYNSYADREAGVKGYDPLTGKESTLTSLAWKSGKGALSIGSAGGARQIINVAAGSEDTDAVNVAQLKKVGELAEKGWQLSANGGKATKVAPGAKVDFSGDDENIIVSKEGTSVQVKLNRNLHVDNVNAGDYFFSAERGIGFGGEAYITQSGLNANNNVISNVAAGVYNTDAVNVGQLKEVEEVAANANKGWNLSTNGVATEATNVAPGEIVDFSGDKNISVSHDGTKVKVELNKDLVDIESISNGDAKLALNGAAGTAGMINGKGASVYMQDGYTVINSKVAFDQNGKISGVAAGEADTDAVNVSQLKNSAWKLAANGVLTEAEDVKADDYVDFNGDQNVSVSKDAKDGVKTVKVELSKDLKDIESISNGDAKMALNGAAGTAGMINGKGASVYMQDGYTVINSKVAFDQNGKISGVAAGEADTDAVNVSQLKSVGATANMGWNLATNGVATEATNVKPGDFVDFSGDKNISVSHDGTKVKVELNKDIDVNSVQTNALNSKYNLSVGTMAENGIMPFFVNSTGDFYAAHNKFHVDKDGKVTATAGEIGNVVLQNGVYYGHSTLQDGSLLLTDDNGNHSYIDAKSAKLGKVTVAEDGKISGVAAGAITADSTDAVNGSQLHAVATEAGKHSKVVNGSNINVEEFDNDGQKIYKVNLNKDIMLGDLTGKYVSISGTNGTIEATGAIATKDRVYADKGAKIST